MFESIVAPMIGANGQNFLAGRAPVAFWDFGAVRSNAPWALSRATAATVAGVGGQVAQVGIDAARIGWAGANCGLVLEAGATNFAVRSSHTAAYPWFSGASAGGVRFDLVAAGELPGGVPYADYRVTGTANATGAHGALVSSSWAFSTGAAVGDAFVSSVYVQLISGVWPSGGPVVHVEVTERTATNLYLNGTKGSTVPGAAPIRVVATRTFSDPSVEVAGVGLGFIGMTPGETVFSGQVLRFYGLQLERGTVPTSLIQTLSGVAGSRAADLWEQDLPGVLPQISGAGALVADFVLRPMDFGEQRILQFGPADESLRLRVTGSGAILAAIVSGGGQIASVTAPGAAVVGDRVKVAIGWTANRFALAINGALCGTPAPSAALPVWSKLCLGSAESGNNHANILFRSLSLYGGEFSNGDLIEGSVR